MKIRKLAFKYLDILYFSCQQPNPAPILPIPFFFHNKAPNYKDISNYQKLKKIMVDSILHLFDFSNPVIMDISLDIKHLEFTHTIFV